MSKEISVLIDGVIEIEAGVDTKAFFDGLFDALIAYVELHEASAALLLSHHPLETEDAKSITNSFVTE
jgi:hypothetical protein